MHLNIRSLPKHFDDLISLLHSLNHNFSVIGLSETWLRSNSCMNQFNLSGYILLSQNRVDKIGGGVALYISSDIHYIPRPDLDRIGKGCFESMFVEIISPNHTKNIFVGVLYKAPAVNFENFF